MKKPKEYQRGAQAFFSLTKFFEIRPLSHQGLSGISRFRIMDSSSNRQTDKDLDWANLVQEMEGIKGRVEQSLEERREAPEPLAPLEEMLSGLSSVEPPTEASARVIPLEPKAAAHKTLEGAESTLSLAVIGALKLRLELTRQSQSVQIHLEENQLRVELSDGTEFRIPLNKAA